MRLARKIWKPLSKIISGTWRWMSPLIVRTKCTEDGLHPALHTCSLRKSVDKQSQPFKRRFSTARTRKKNYVPPRRGKSQQSDYGYAGHGASWNMQPFSKMPTSKENGCESQTLRKFDHKKRLWSLKSIWFNWLERKEKRSTTLLLELWHQHQHLHRFPTFSLHL